MKLNSSARPCLRQIVYGYLTCVAVFQAAAAQADELLVAVAANFVKPMQAIATGFKQETGHTITLSPGSSGKLFAQIVNGAPYDVFFSADQAKPIALEQRSKIVPDSRITYAVGQLALWSSDPSRVKQGQTALKQPFVRLALANPKLAPYGAAARQVLEHLGLLATEARWVFGESIAQTYQFVATGNAELGFVAVSQILNNGQLTGGSAWVVPTCMHDPIRQDAVILQQAANKPAALELMNYMLKQAVPIMDDFGYSNASAAADIKC